MTGLQAGLRRRYGERPAHLLLLPGYVLADAALVALWRRAPGRLPWLNFVRFPAAISALLLLLLYAPVTLETTTAFASRAGRSTEGYLGDWLLVSAAVAGISATCYLARLAAVRRGSAR